MHDREQDPPRRHPTENGPDRSPDPRLDGRSALVLGSALAAGGSISTVEPARAAAPLALAESSGAQGTRVELRINGQAHVLEVDTRSSLLDLLRERLHLTGTKKGCNAGACGACTILLNGHRINACLTLAAMHGGAEIITIEGLSAGEHLHPLQTAFIEHDAFQCGYCTPGQIMSGVACIQEGHAGSAAEIRAWMSGNICRCGAYPGILDAIQQVGNERT